MKNRRLLSVVVLLWCLGYMSFAQDVITGWSTDFETPWTEDEENLFWPDRGQHGDPLVYKFENSQFDDAGNTVWQVIMNQQQFFDGQFLNFPKIGKVFDLTNSPYFSFKIKVDPATNWLWPDWSTGSPGLGQNKTTMPMQVSAWNVQGGTRLGLHAFNVPIDGQWHEYQFLFYSPGVDLSSVEAFLMETVEWPNANKATFWIDDLKIGDAVAVDKATGIAVTTTSGLQEITTKGGELTLTSNFEGAPTITSASYKIISGTGHAWLLGGNRVKAVSDGQVKAVGFTRDGSDLQDTITITISNNITTGVKTYTQNFDSGDPDKYDPYLWAPNNSTVMVGEVERKQFIVTRTNNEMKVDMQQKEFFDGQVYDFRKALGTVFDLNESPFVSMQITVFAEGTEWKMPDWGVGAPPDIFKLSTDVPFQVSLFKGGTRLASYAYRVPIGAAKQRYYFTFDKLGVDFSEVDRILVESVEWPFANKAVYAIDDFRIGTAASPPVKATEISLATESGATAIEANAGKLKLVTTFTPANATLPVVSYKVISGTGHAVITGGTEVMGVSDGDVKVVAIARDGSNMTDTLDLTISNNIVTVTTYNQNFDSGDADKFDLYLWAPVKDSVTVGDVERKKFIVTRDNNEMKVDMQQKEFFDGQMYDFKKAAGLMFNLTDAPFMSMQITVNAAGTEWKAPDWGAGSPPDVFKVADHMPFQVSLFKGDERLSSYNVMVPVNDTKVRYFFSFMYSGQDISAVEKILVESVEWPFANKAVYRIDDFRVGTVAEPVTKLSTITLSTNDNVDSIATLKGSLKIFSLVAPDNAQLKKIYWMSSDESIATVDQDGLVKAVGGANGSVTITAKAMDGGTAEATFEVEVMNQIVGLKKATSSEFSIYPNPASDYINFRNASQIERFVITNLAGQTVKAELLAGRARVDVSDLHSGAYIVKIHDIKGNIHNARFIKK